VLVGDVVFRLIENVVLITQQFSKNGIERSGSHVGVEVVRKGGSLRKMSDQLPSDHVRVNISQTFA